CPRDLWLRQRSTPYWVTHRIALEAITSGQLFSRRCLRPRLHPGAAEPARLSAPGSRAAAVASKEIWTRTARAGVQAGPGARRWPCHMEPGKGAGDAGRGVAGAGVGVGERTGRGRRLDGGRAGRRASATGPAAPPGRRAAATARARAGAGEAGRAAPAAR